MKTTYSIYLAGVDRNKFVAGFAEIVELLHFSIADLGYTVHIAQSLPTSGRPIILAGHLLTEEEAALISDDAIIYQFEQLPAFMSATYEKLLRRCVVWDYAERNLDYLESIGIKGTFVPLGYHPDLERIPVADKDIPILFYGALTAPRASVVEEMKRRGLDVHCVAGVYHIERDNYVARSNIVLNMHQWKAQVHEIARTFYLLTNKVCVLSECNKLTYIYPWLTQAMVLSKYNDLPSMAQRLSKDPEWQKDVALRGYEILKSKPMMDILALHLKKGEANEYSGIGRIS
jgi:hypothetical protein